MTTLKLKKISDQTIVITGASSGIGLETSRQAVAAGANVVLASRNLKELKTICAELNSKGPGRAVAIECDVKDADAVEKLAAEALSQFGEIDTWVNNAGVTVFGKLTVVPLEEKRELFETNFWGTVYGCRSAVRALRESGGAIINIGSVLSERAVPMQGMYSASKHAVKAYTESLRMELEADDLPISVTLIKPAAIDTPYIDHGTNHMSHHPTHVQPVYSPSIVAKAILSAAVNGGRDIYVGGAGPVFAFMEQFFPRLTDKLMEHQMMEAGQTDPKMDAGIVRPNLRHAPTEEGLVRGSYGGFVNETSIYTEAKLHPVATAVIATGLGLAAAAGINFLLNSRKHTASPKKTAATARKSRAASNVTQAPLDPTTLN